MPLVEVNDLRLRMLSNEPITDDELATAVDTLREDRMLAKPVQAGSKKKKLPALFDLTEDEET